MTEPNSYIPRNEEEMDRVKEGDIVLITLRDKDFVAIDKTFWALYLGNGPLIDSFLVQERLEVLNYVQVRRTYNYDEKKGVIVPSSNNMDLESPLRFDPSHKSYAELSGRLKKAGLWQEPGEVIA